MSNRIQYDDEFNQLKDGEIWVGNIRGTEVPKHYQSLRTARVGEQAYALNGDLIPRDYMRPLIIHKSEEEAHARLMKKMMALASQGKDWKEV